MQRNTRFEMRVTAEELRKLHELAEADGIPAAALVRQLIRRIHDERRRLAQDATALSKGRP